MKIKIEHGTVKETMGEYEAIARDEHAYVSVSDWPNGDGYCVELNETGCQATFSMTLDQWWALKKTMKAHEKLP